MIFNQRATRLNPVQFILGFLIGAMLFGVLSSFATFAFTSSGATTTLTVPSGSTGRKVSLYNTSGAEAYTVISGSTSAVIGTITTGTYFWRITDTDGSVFFDNSDWGTVTNGDTWAWANSNLTKDATWNLVVAGDSDSDGNCTDAPDAGCYMKLQRNGSDYMFMGPRLGNNLAAGKQVLAADETMLVSMPNPSFETGTGVDADDWVESVAADRVSDKAFLGTYAMKFVAPTAAQATISTQTIEAGSNYTLWARIYNGMNGTGDNYAYVDLNDILGECNTWTSPSSNWQEVSCNFNVFTTSVTLRLVVHGTATNTGSVWFDGIRLVKGNVNTITWTSLTNTTATPAVNDLKKTGGTNGVGDADAISVQTISSFVSGYGMSTKVGQTNGELIIGLSSDDPNADYLSIDYAINPSTDGLVYIHENGVYKSPTYGCGTPAYTTSTILSIRLNSSGYPQYLKDGVVLCTSTTLPTYPLFIDTSIYTSNASFIDVKLVNSSLSTAEGDGMARNATDESTTPYKATRWLGLSNQWICVDLGSSTTFDRVHLIQRDNEGYGGNSISIQVSSSDDGCVNNFSNVSGTTISRPQRQTTTVFTFSSQTKRYVRMYFTSSFTRPEADEIEIYNEEESGSLYGDMENIILYDGTTKIIIPALLYDSYTNDADGSITFTKNGIKSQSGTCGTINCLDITVNYKKMSNDAWRKRITLNYDAAARVSMKNVLYRSGISDTCVKIDSDSSAICSTANNDAKYFQMSAVSIPYVFGLVPDNGCNAKWTLLNGTHTTAFSDNMEVTGFDNATQWREAYVTYGKQCGANTACDGKSTMELAANTNLVFDIGIFRSLDPAQFKVRQKAPISLADINDKAGLSEFDRLLWASAYQLFRVPRTTEQDYCGFFSSQNYSGNEASNGFFHADNTHIIYSLGDQEKARKTIMAFGKASNVGAGSIINENDPFAQSPPTLVGGNKDSIWSGIMLGHAYKKGYITFSTNSACGETDNSCVQNSVRDAVCTNLDSRIASNGWTFDNISPDSFISDFKDNNNLTDSRTAHMLLHALAYRGIKETGAPCFNQTKLDTLMTNISSLYNASDGYIHNSRYGHWQPVSAAGANGGTYYEGMGDYIAPATARFVVPSGTNQSLTVHYRKAPNTSGCPNGCYGKLIIKKNGTAVTQSPIDLYNASESFTSTAITETVSTGDVLTFEVANSKNASSNGYKVSLDALVIGGTTYQETDANFACGSLGSDCFNGYTRGWKRWKSIEILLYEAIFQNTYSESFFTDAQIISHIEHLPSGNMGNGSIIGHYQKQDDTCLESGYWIPGESSCKTYQNGGSWLQVDAAIWNLAYRTANNPLIGYKWDEKSSKFVTTGSWSNETDSANYYQQYVWKSTTVNDYIVFSGVPFTDAEVYMQSPSSCGATVFFDNGSGYDAGVGAGTTNPVYTKTGQAYSWGYKIKVRVDSGTCRLDYIKAKSKALDMLNFRLAEEFVKEPSGKEFLVSDYYHADYENTLTGRGGKYLGWNLLYRGGILTNYPKWRGMFEGIYYRRVN